MYAVDYTNKDVNKFFLQLMADNALVTYNAFSPQEKDLSPQFKKLADRFDALLARAQASLEQTEQINNEAYTLTLELRKALLDLIKLMVTTRYHVDIKPIILNYFVDEAEDYTKLINGFKSQKTPSFNLLTEESAWLPVFSTQSRYIADHMGYYQEQTRTYAQHLAHYLTNHAAFSDELVGLTRTGVQDFPMLRQHHIAVMELLNRYYMFLNNIIEMVKQRKLQGFMSLLYLDRARRSLCFFLNHAAAALGTKPPDCDPYTKRISTD